jgi:hypothetical protein
MLGHNTVPRLAAAIVCVIGLNVVVWASCPDDGLRADSPCVTMLDVCNVTAPYDPFLKCNVVTQCSAQAQTTSKGNFQCDQTKDKHECYGSGNFAPCQVTCKKCFVDTTPAPCNRTCDSKDCQPSVAETKVNPKCP